LIIPKTYPKKAGRVLNEHGFGWRGPKHPPPPGALLNVNAERTKAAAEAARLLSGGENTIRGERGQEAGGWRDGALGRGGGCEILCLTPPPRPAI